MQTDVVCPRILVQTDVVCPKTQRQTDVVCEFTVSPMSSLRATVDSCVTCLINDLRAHLPTVNLNSLPKSTLRNYAK